MRFPFFTPTVTSGRFTCCDLDVSVGRPMLLSVPSRSLGGNWMQFGWLTLALSPSPEEDAARIAEQIEQACAAERLGFSDVWLTEHYFTGESVYNDALLFASALTMRTTRIRIGFAVLQM